MPRHASFCLLLLLGTTAWSGAMMPAAFAAGTDNPDAVTDPEAVSVVGTQSMGNSATSPGTRRHSTTQVTIVSNAH